MITFFLGISVLILGGIYYSKIIERIEGVEAERRTPAYRMGDGIDYIPLPWWKVFLIQFLNIAGLGPIFGAIAGAMWGPVAFLWIIFGCLFGGAVHDYFSGMISLRHDGMSITEIVGTYLGIPTKIFMRVFTIFLMVLVGAVFVTGPAGILGNLTTNNISVTTWIWIIFIYYFIATMMPVDKIIGRIYPVFGFVLLTMALAILVALFAKGYRIPEMSFANLHSNKESYPIFPMMFVTIACGAVSGFHSTQSPMMARCLKNEKEGRIAFYGAMVTEGVVTMIWAAIGMAFYRGVNGLNEVMMANGGQAAIVVSEISSTLLGKIGGILVIIGVVIAPITTGDTAFRSSRLIVADFMKYDQEPIKNRLLVSLPLFALGIFITQIDFAVLWRYMAWTNQTLAVFVFWAITVYLVQRGKCYWVALVPALFMTGVCTTYILFAPEGFSLPARVSYLAGTIAVITAIAVFWNYMRKREKSQLKGGSTLNI
jgi:carbon starvation protein CstA